ncbi:hypothetical protein GCM10025880_39680 [Methylorubrum aminovorans]|nr:hypothetical protein GCM10025880_39680 [Methylorubrum aminovorans]
MRAGAGLYRLHARRVDQPGAAQALGILLGDEVVGDHGEIDAARLKRRDQTLDQRGLAGADRAADADAGGGDGLGQGRGGEGGYGHRSM